MQRVTVAMSGGVDSAGAALLLKRAGYDVSGVTLRLHHFCDQPDICGSAQDSEEAKSVCDQIGIPHTILDFCELFEQKVMKYFVAEYECGRTPNPCIDCNREIKFGALMDWARAQGAEKLATGHYARVSYDSSSGRWLLLRGKDRRKDQSYVLYQLTQEQLAHLLLPIGEYDKPNVRKIATEAGLLNAKKPDSQDICFVPDGDYVAFLKSFGKVSMQPGNFIDKNGNVLGHHHGQECYTIGQRKGLGVSANEPVYVVYKDLKNNTVTLGPNRDLFTKELMAEKFNLISLPALTEPIRVTAKTRYSQREAMATAEMAGENQIHIVFDEPQRAVTAGQAVVLYDGECVVGGGTIL